MDFVVFVVFVVLKLTRTAISLRTFANLECETNVFTMILLLKMSNVLCKILNCGFAELQKLQKLQNPNPGSQLLGCLADWLGVAASTAWAGWLPNKPFHPGSQLLGCLAGWLGVAARTAWAG